MNALETTFPQTQNLLCVWHIEKNVVSHCKQHFATGEEWEEFLRHWTRVVKSGTTEDYYGQWEDLCVRYRDKAVVVSYLRDTWLRFEERFVSAWADRHLHLGNTATS